VARRPAWRFAGTGREGAFGVANLISAVRAPIGVLSLAFALLANGCATKPPPQPAAEAPPAQAAAGQPAPLESPPSAAGAITAFKQAGTGRLLAPPKKAADLQVNAAGAITMNFVNADIREVVRTVLADALKLNYLIDPDVKGTITMQTSKPLAPAALLTVLEEVLRLNDVALVPAGGLYRVVPAKDAPRSAAPPNAGRIPSRDGFALQVVPLGFVAAGEMRKILETFAPEGAIRYVDETRNLLILGGSNRELETLLGAIELFDTDWMTGMSFAVIPVQYADVKVLAAELEKVFGDPAKTPAAPVRLIPIERLNAIMVITAQPLYLERAQEWIARLDQSGEEGGTELFVYYVKNGVAAELAKVLGEALGTGSTSTSETARKTSGVAPGLATTELRGSPGDAGGLGASRTGAGAPGAMGATGLGGPIAGAASPTKTDTARAGAATVTANLQMPGDGTRIAGAQTARIVSDDSRNALLVVATARQYRMIESTLRKLDLMPMQVLIEATIAEVTLTDDLRYGVQWFVNRSQHQTAFSSAASGAVAATFPGLNYIFSSASARVALDALSTITDLKVISSPQLMVMDNQTAKLQVGDQVPIITQQSASTVASATTALVSTVQYRDTGVILEVTPRVNPSGLVTLDIKQEVSEVGAAGVGGSPTISQRSVSSRIAVKSGESVILGGLIRDRQRDSRDGIPLLSKIPILGGLFGSSDDSALRTELMVVLSPTVVPDVTQARDVTEELRRRMRSLAPLDAKIR
jgi:general secretion pathway protein D